MQAGTINTVSTNLYRKLSTKQKKDCILINEVKSNKFLYDRSEMNHKRSKLRQKAWEEIGTILNMDGIDCMNRWKILRDRYRKEKRFKFRDSSSKKRKKWLYYELFSFLNPYLEEVKPMHEDLEDVIEKAESCDASAEDLSQLDFQLMKAELAQQHFNNLSQHKSSHIETPVQFIKLLVPPNNPPPALQSQTKKISRKYVKILPKTETFSQSNAQCSLSQSQTTTINCTDNSGLSPSKNKVDTVDHLMAFMGNTIKQLSINKQVKICQDLTSAFFNIISNNDDDDEEEEDDDS